MSETWSLLLSERLSDYPEAVRLIDLDGFYDCMRKFSDEPI